jgi:hypothetical protein
MTTVALPARWLPRLAALCVLLPAAAPTLAQEPPPAPDTAYTTSRDTYRLRVENVRYGRIEVSVDCGEHFLLIGRVTRSATVPAADRQALRAPSVVRSSGDGIAFATGDGQVLKLLPAQPPRVRGKAPPCAVETDLPPHAGLFGDFCPPPGTAALEQAGRDAWRPLPAGFTPTDDDVFAFVVTVPSIHSEGAGDPDHPPTPGFLARLAAARKQLADLAARYTDGAMARAKEAGRSVVSGLVTLRPKLPTGEPEPITAITYCVDGDIVSAQNVFPSNYGWDTTRCSNGEHVVEVRALSKYATVVTRARTLVVVNNP